MFLGAMLDGLPEALVLGITLALGGSVGLALVAAGAVLTMLANSMMPEAFKHGGKTVGLLTVLGYLVAAALTVLQ
jgi:hypothetical protein